MFKDKTKKICLLAITGLILVTGFSASKYVQSKSSNLNAPIAKWNVTVDDVALTNNKYTETTITTGKLAPGTEGYFNIVIKANDTEVGVKYDVTINNLTGKPGNLYFMIEGSDTKYADTTTLGRDLSGIINADATNKTVTKKVYYKWDYETTKSPDGSRTTADANNQQDTTDGLAARPMTFTVKVDCSQVHPVAR